jgi:hypothetical protein
LAAEAFDFGDRDALNANAGEGFAHLIELERFDDGRDEFHVRFLLFKQKSGAAEAAPAGFRGLW